MSPSKILVVDDDPNLTHLLGVILGRVGGYDVREETRPFAALQAARSFRPDLILLNRDMPGKDGRMLPAAISNDAVLANTPILFVNPFISRSESGGRNGQRYLPKPVDPRRLLDAVGGICPRFRPEVAA